MTANDETYRLLTTLVDPDEAPAAQLALACAQRWEIEAVFDELKTHQRGARKVLRSKSPELVLQEIWGHLCCHYAIRTLMLEAAAGMRPPRRATGSSDWIPRQTRDRTPGQPLPVPLLGYLHDAGVLVGTRR